MKFVSTRNKTEKKSFSDALIKGLSDDGGLFVPDEFPIFTHVDMDKLCEMSYFERAEYILSRFSEFPVGKIVEKGYEGSFEEDEPAPLLKLDDGLFILELFHGPTLAFKDLALRLLPGLIAAAKAQAGDKTRSLVLTATSGDTGKAAMDAFADADGIDVMVFYPYGGVSKAQELQMTTQEGANVSAVAVRGNFDDCQRAVKDAMNDRSFVEELKKQGYSVCSANSINIGRLLPQIVYYFSAYADMLSAGEVKKGGKVNFAVPTGNFGNILAGYYAKKMGLPVNMLICASNENNVLTDFFATGEYNANRELKKTISPSMDILVSSNLERLLFELCGRDDGRIRELFDALKGKGVYKISEDGRKKTAEDFFAWCADEEVTKSTIQAFFDEYDYLLDPHTATAIAAREKYCGMTHDKAPTVVVATAHPYKFAPAVYEAVMDIDEPDAFRAAAELEDISAVEIPAQISGLKSKKKLHNTVIEKAKIKDTIIEFLRSKK